jgi:nucleoside-diphosphate-sugar epimerase
MSKDSLHVVIGAGPLGRAVAEEASRAGNRVRIVSRSGRATLPGVDPVAADMLLADAARAACAGAAVVYQCAAPAYQHWARDFPTLQENVLQGAVRAGAVLVAAENLYGYGVAGTLHEGLPMVATTRKGRTRAALSERLMRAHADGEVRTVAGRASDVFGPGVRVSATGERLWPALLAGKSVGWLGDPDLPHSLTYLPDFARALVTLGSDERAWGRAWHVPSPAPLTPRQVIGRVARLAGLAAPTIKPISTFGLRLAGLLVPAAGELVEMAYLFQAPLIMDDTAFRTAFGHEPADWDTALAATLAFWQDERRR